MPAAARALWEKTFFPERIFKRKDKYQVFGWSPEVFASNAHKMAAALKDTTLSPYPIDPATGSFTEAGWRELFADTQTFVRNQMAGQTGAGEALVVPKGSQPGIFAPASRPAEAVPLDQTRADFINMLFNSRLPDTPAVKFLSLRFKTRITLTSLPNFLVNLICTRTPRKFKKLPMLCIYYDNVVLS